MGHCAPGPYLGLALVVQAALQVLHREVGAPREGASRHEGLKPLVHDVRCDKQGHCQACLEWVRGRGRGRWEGWEGRVRADTKGSNRWCMMYAVTSRVTVRLACGAHMWVSG